MQFTPFSQKYPGEFLTPSEDNFEMVLKQLKIFHDEMGEDVDDGKCSRRQLDRRFNYEKELENVKANQNGVSVQQIAKEFKDMFQGCIRHQDTKTAINIIPTPLISSVVGITLASLYNPNVCWDLLSGKLCLYEKKIVRMLGNMVGWSHADGFVITGGKQSLAYAIRNGIGRAKIHGSADMDQYVVICSSLAHYSIEHVCCYLGMNAKNCIRVPTHVSGEIDLHSFEETLERVILQGQRVAAVIAVGGGTIDLIPDPISLIKKSIDDIARKHTLDYIPYLHVDSVITWAWLSFENTPDCFLDCKLPGVAKKIEHVVCKLAGIQDADSFAADFHKTGFCSYSAGVFITKDSSNLAGMTSDKYIFKETRCFGELEPFQQTFENSRSALGIVSIWIALRKMGLAGLRDYILYQLEVCEVFKQKIRDNFIDHFEILNDLSNGWEIVFKPHFRNKLTWNQLQEASTNEQQNYIDDCHAFLNDLWYEPIEQQKMNYPVIGFIRKYSRARTNEQSFPAFVIHPTSLHYNEMEIEQMIRDIYEVKMAFTQKNAESVHVDEYLCSITPPR